MVIMLTCLLTSTRNFICSSVSCSSRPVLVLMLKGIFIIHAICCIVCNDCGLHLNNALPHQVLMTFLAGHHIFNSTPANISAYLFWISAKHLRSISAFPPNIWAMTGACALVVRRCLMTPGGLIIYPSAFINSVRRVNSYLSFSPYFSKISFVIWRNAQSVNQSMGDKPNIITNSE